MSNYLFRRSNKYEKKQRDSLVAESRLTVNVVIDHNRNRGISQLDMMDPVYPACDYSVSSDISDDTYFYHIMLFNGGLMLDSLSIGTCESIYRLLETLISSCGYTVSGVELWIHHSRVARFVSLALDALLLDRRR